MSFSLCPKKEEANSNQGRKNPSMLITSLANSSCPKDVAMNGKRGIPAVFLYVAGGQMSKYFA